jgi:hypothetical protein
MAADYRHPSVAGALHPSRQTAQNVETDLSSVEYENLALADPMKVADVVHPPVADGPGEPEALRQHRDRKPRNRRQDRHGDVATHHRISRKSVAGQLVRRTLLSAAVTAAGIPDSWPHSMKPARREYER